MYTYIKFLYLYGALFHTSKCPRWQGLPGCLFAKEAGIPSWVDWRAMLYFPGSLVTMQLLDDTITEPSH
jgi:hypothetical protein